MILILNLNTPIVLGEKQTQYVYTLSYIFENRGTTNFNLTQDDVSIPFFMNTSWQKVVLDELDQNYSIETIDEDGNKGVIVGLDRVLLPGQKLSFTAKYNISSLCLSTQ